MLFNFEYFADRLIQSGLMDHERIMEVKRLTQNTGRNFFECINEFEAESMPLFLKENFGMETISRNAKPDVAALALVHSELAYRYKLVPVVLQEDTIYIAFSDPFLLEAFENLERVLDKHINVWYVKPRDVNFLLDTFYKQPLKENPINIVKENNDELSEVNNAPAARAINHMLDAAVMESASDIHIEPFEFSVRVRFRIDGILIEFESLDKQLLPSVVSRLKIMGGMDIAERRLPQDGHFKQVVNNIKIDFRVSTIQTVFGEKAVIRLIYERHNVKDKSKLGFYKDDLKKIEHLINSPNGAVLLTGPTGSGKTTTMASLLNDLNHGEKNIVTIEDPVENNIYGINQININQKAGLNFASILRSILRQDPDIIMIGEIRDSETASIAVRAAVTGHLVLSTLHTNDALSAIYRLIDMDVNDYLVYAALRGIISQRLVRKICPNCKEEALITVKESLLTGLSSGTSVYRGRGCEHCNNTGYKSRFAIYEILTIEDELIAMLQKNLHKADILKYLKENGMRTIWDCGIRALMDGKTTVEEVIKVCYKSE